MEPLDAADFVALLTQNQTRLFSYVLSLVGNPTQAEDVLQESNAVLWQKRAHFTPGTHFQAWMLKIAYLQVMAYRQRRNREKLLFDTEALGELAKDSTSSSENSDEKQRALWQCMEKLSPRHRDMIRRRYSVGASLESIAKDAGLTTDAIKQALFRARTALIECVKRSLGAQPEGAV